MEKTWKREWTFNIKTPLRVIALIFAVISLYYAPAAIVAAHGRFAGYLYDAVGALLIASLALSFVTLRVKVR